MFSPNSFNSQVFYSTSLKLPYLRDSNAIYISDENTVNLLKKSAGYIPSVPLLVLPSGEEHKNIKTIEKILEIAISNRLDRNCTFIGVGGGVITDMVGFAASIYMRGVPLILVPTTLLAMVDASIGGKTAIDFLSYKNIVGSFYLPKEIYICEESLKTLPKEQYFSGLGELLKIALINRANIYQKINDNVSFFLNEGMSIEIIKEAIEGKLEIVNNDFYEKKEIRAFLNLGHTFAHALEAVLGFKNITHGQAVVWGIQKALKLGKMLGKTNKKYADEVLSLTEKLNYRENDINKKLSAILKENDIATVLVEKMKMDKKNKNAKIRLVLQEDLGRCFLTEAREEEIKEVLL